MLLSRLNLRFCLMSRPISIAPNDCFSLAFWTTHLFQFNKHIANIKATSKKYADNTLSIWNMSIMDGDGRDLGGCCHGQVVSRCNVRVTECKKYRGGKKARIWNGQPQNGLGRHIKSSCVFVQLLRIEMISQNDVKMFSNRCALFHVTWTQFMPSLRVGMLGYCYQQFCVEALHKSLHGHGL